MTTPGTAPHPAPHVSVGDVVVGSGRPRLIVALTGRTRGDLLAEAAALAAPTQAAAVDIVEWRVDLLEGRGGGEGESLLSHVPELARALTDALAPANGVRGQRIPVLGTVRTKAEGGAFDGDAEDYERLVLALSAAAGIDAVDVEYAHPRAGRVLAAVKGAAAPVPVVVSNHDFIATPSRAQLVARLTTMAAMGADIAKIAVMPQSTVDVLTLLAATEEARRAVDVPLITMAMGPLGALSRVAGEAVGSAATFGRVGEGSAPGQLPAVELARVLDILHVASAPDEVGEQ